MTWEYKKVIDRTGNIDELNKLGKDGWELVAVEKSHSLSFPREFILKRESKILDTAPR